MKEKIKEILFGIWYGVITMLFMIGVLPWALVSSLLGCAIAMLAVWRIVKKTRAGENVTAFTISYMAVIITCMLFLNAISA